MQVELAEVHAHMRLYVSSPTTVFERPVATSGGADLRSAVSVLEPRLLGLVLLAFRGRASSGVG